MSPHDDMHDGMHNGIHDDPAFDEYLKRDSALSRQYQNSSTDEVPPELNQKILAQAHAAINGRKVVTHPLWWIKWNKPLALAATLMLAFTVIYHVGHQSIEQLAAPEAPVALTQKEMPAATHDNSTAKMDNVPAAKAVAPSARMEPKKESAPLSLDAVPHQSHGVIAPRIVTQSKASAAPPIEAPELAPAPMPAPALSHDKDMSKARNKTDPVSESAQVVDSISAEDIGKFPDASVTESMQRISGASISRSTSSAQQLKKSATDPDQALQHIRDLRKQGKQKQADKAWRQFQKDFPDYPVAKDDAARGDSK